jgi:hypothetical protein
MTGSAVGMDESPQARDPVGDRVAAAPDRKRGVEHRVQLVATTELGVGHHELIPVDGDGRTAAAQRGQGVREALSGDRPIEPADCGRHRR